jgi:hypothetical protein
LCAIGTVRERLGAFGVSIIPKVLNDEECDAMIARMWNTLKHWKLVIGIAVIAVCGLYAWYRHYNSPERIYRREVRNRYHYLIGEYLQCPECLRYLEITNNFSKTAIGKFIVKHKMIKYKAIVCLQCNPRIRKKELPEDEKAILYAYMCNKYGGDLSAFGIYCIDDY